MSMENQKLLALWEHKIWLQIFYNPQLYGLQLPRANIYMKTNRKLYQLQRFIALSHCTRTIRHSGRCKFFSQRSQQRIRQAVWIRHSLFTARQLDRQAKFPAAPGRACNPHIIRDYENFPLRKQKVSISTGPRAGARRALQETSRGRAYIKNCPPPRALISNAKPPPGRRGKTPMWYTRRGGQCSVFSQVFPWRDARARIRKTITITSCIKRRPPPCAALCTPGRSNSAKYKVLMDTRKFRRWERAPARARRSLFTPSPRRAPLYTVRHRRSCTFKLII